MPHAPQAPEKLSLQNLTLSRPNQVIDKPHVSTRKPRRSNNTLINNNYPECIAKTYNFESQYRNEKEIQEPKFSNLNEPPKKSELYNCSVGYKVGHTKSGIFFKSLVCNKEYCETCGKDYSISHQRRIMRVFPKIITLKKAGYFVITIPKELRETFKNKKQLNKLRTYIRRKLKRGQTLKIGNYQKTFYKVKQAFLRWHWCGDDGKNWKPHLNIIVDLGHVEQWYLKALKHDLRRYFEREYKLKYTPKINLYYAFLKTKSLKGKYKLKHWINYITRATAKHLNCPDSLETIQKYRNISYLGKFEKTTYATSRAASIIANGIDLETGEKIFWEKGILKKKIFNSQFLPYVIDLDFGLFYYTKSPDI